MEKFTKTRKSHQGLILGSNIPELKYGNFGLFALESGRVSSKVFETLSKMFKKETEKAKKKLRLVFRVFYKNRITKKPAETRMGGGRGAVELITHAKVKKGSVLLEIVGTKDQVFVKQMLKHMTYKLPISVEIMSDNL